MTDWAEEMASWLCGMSVCAGEPHHIATALRKAKADALREAADTMRGGSFEEYSDERGFEFLDWKFEAWLRQRAAEIEGKTDGQQ